jgi:putative exporter of polyketide antibiotics
MEQQSIAIQDLSRRLDDGLLEIRQEVRETNGRMDQGFQAVNARIDRLFLATWAIGGGIIAALVVQIARSG